MKTTQHFEAQIVDRGISREWCERAVDNPIQTARQANGRTRYWAYIEEVSRYLRVVVPEDGETLHTAYFDRNFRRKNRP